MARASQSKSGPVSPKDAPKPSHAPALPANRAKDTVITMQTQSDGTIKRARPANTPSVAAHAEVSRFHRDHATLLKLCSRGPSAEMHKPEYVFDEVDDYLAQMKPSNPAERMLAIQMLWNHQRISQLSIMASQQTLLNTVQAVHRALDEAMNLARRQALAWSQIKAPRPVQIIRGETVNMAEQQVVGIVNMAGQTHPSRANEQGSSTHGTTDRILHAEPSALTPPVSAHPCGLGVAQGRDCPHPPVGAEYRPTHPKG